MITWMTRQEAADHLRVSVDTIDRYARDSKIKKYTVAGTRSIRFKVTELDALLAPEEETACKDFTTDQWLVALHLGEVAANVGDEKWLRFGKLLGCEHASFEVNAGDGPDGFVHWASCADCGATAEDLRLLDMPILMPCGVQVHPGEMTGQQLDDAMGQHRLEYARFGGDGEVEMDICLVEGCPSPNRRYYSEEPKAA